VVHLLERECSVQRRHQKVVEETPSPAVDDALRARMGAAAVAAAKAVGYEGAGTVEFLVAGDTLDTDEPEFFFLEMNTRLQVEHPVTELGHRPRPRRAAAARRRRRAARHRARTTWPDGHALEVRLYAEDPVAQLPQTGTVAALAVPDGPRRPGRPRRRGRQRGQPPLRPDARQADRARPTGTLVPADVVAARAQHRARGDHQPRPARRDRRAPAFVAGELTTGFLDDHLADWAPAPAPDVALVAAAVAVQDAVRREGPAGDPHRPWDTLGPFRPGRSAAGG
jgi:hypothetical protein